MESEYVEKIKSFFERDMSVCFDRTGDKHSTYFGTHLLSRTNLSEEEQRDLSSFQTVSFREIVDLEKKILSISDEKVNLYNLVLASGEIKKLYERDATKDLAALREYALDLCGIE